MESFGSYQFHYRIAHTILYLFGSPKIPERGQPLRGNSWFIYLEGRMFCMKARKFCARAYWEYE